VPDPVVLDEALLIGCSRYDDVRPKAPHLETSLGIQRTQPLDRRRRQQVHDGKIEERSRRQLPLCHGVPVLQTLHIRPVLLRLRARRFSIVLCLGERDLAAERPRQDLRQIGLLARHDSPIGQRQPDGGQLRPPLRRLDIGCAEIEEVAPLARVLRARDFSGRRVHHGELPIPDEAAIRNFGGIQLLPHHRLHRVAPQPNNRPSLDLRGRRVRRFGLHGSPLRLKLARAIEVRSTTTSCQALNRRAWYLACRLRKPGFTRRSGIRGAVRRGGLGA
jgi:hypothetical protein